MRTFRIPEWDNDSGVTHIATTWQLASDIDFNNIIAEVVDSTQYLNYWTVNVVVPVGKVYYVRAKRKFKEVENDVWIGPKKVVNNEAGLGEILKPDMKIDQPYISNVTLDYEDGLTIELSPYKGSVPHRATTWIIKDIDTGEIIYLSMNDTENLTKLNIKPDVVDFTKYAYVTLVVIYHGELGVESPPNIEFIEISKKYYTIEANKKIVPSEMDYEGSIKQLSSRVVNLIGAELYRVDGVKVCDGIVENNTFKFPSSCLVPKMSYTVKLTLEFDNDENTRFQTSYTFFTKTISEKVVFDRDRYYKYLPVDLLKSTCLVLDKENEDLESNGLKTDIQVLTEETYVGVIPMPGKDSNLKAYFYSKNDGYFNYVKDINLNVGNLSNFLKIELLPGNIMCIDTVVDDTRTLFVYRFNPYTLELESLVSLNREDEFIPTYNPNSYGVLNGTLYWASIDKNDKTKVFIRKLDKENNEVVTLYHGVIDDSGKELDNVLFTRVYGDRFVVIPVVYDDTEEFFGYVYDNSKNELYKLFTIPVEVRGKEVMINSLDNGNALIYRTSLEDGKLYYAIVDGGESETIETKYSEVMIDDDLKLVNNVKLKSGNIISFGFVDDKGTSLLWS